MSKSIKSKKFSLVIIAATFLSNSMYANADTEQDAVIIQSSGVSITATDLQVELAKAPVEVRNSLLFNKERLSQLAANLLMRRALAKQAESAGLTNRPENQAALNLARDRVLSDLQLQALDEINKPSQAALEKRAMDVYQAEPKRFEAGEEVKASHILILSSTENAEDKAKGLLQEVKSGKDFAELAKIHSQDPGSGAKGGDLGFFGRGRMVKEFEDTAFALNAGEVSDIVKSQFGYHIIKVVERKMPGKQPFEQVRDMLMTEASQKILTEGRVKAGEKIMSNAKSFAENLNAFVASQAKK